MSPGLAVDKVVLSSRDLTEHSNKAKSWTCSQISAALNESDDGIKGAKIQGENLLDLLCFGSQEV